MLSPSAMQTNATTKSQGPFDTGKKLIAAGILLALASTASAQDAPATADTNQPAAFLTNAPAPSEPVNQAGTFGLGPLVGEPTGLGMKLWLSSRTAIDAGAAWSFLDPDGFQVHGDFLFHKFDLFHVSKGELPLYFGVGGRVKFVEHGDNRAGIRGPVGIAYLFPHTRLELFAEVAPILDLAPTTSLEWNGGAGIRFYFH